MVDFTCKLCNEVRIAHDNLAGSENICLECARAHGLRARTEPMRPRIPCSRCGHTELVRALLRERGAHLSVERGNQPFPMAVTFGLGERKGFFGSHQGYFAALSSLMGPLEAYVCRKCGFTELYAHSPSNIPIGDEFGTELFSVGGDGPYR